MDNSYRIKANVGIDQVLNVNLKQGIDIYEILSLKLRQENLYKLHSADYGVIVGRVLANDAFGVPNAKITVFIPLSDTDKLRQDIKNIYPYKSVTDTDSRNVKFNTLPNYKKSDCHQEVGSFPKKQLVLDDDSVLEVYDKYYKYTTITNNAGDYMIFGVPTGEQILHVDVDLSDIGIISQEPRDFIYKGYSMDLFESPTQFKKSTNLDDLPQIQNQNASVTVYPLWGDKSTNEIAITRKDINLQYKFETTCVFLGSVITDSGSNSIGSNCVPDANVGEASQLVPNKGNIEMIRKTINDTVEEFPIKGNQLIDGDGTWCYQIPMNLDYVGTDECGNIVPTNNPSKGIPTRARVRFRVTLDESGEGDLVAHKARYLIPNNPDMYEGHTYPTMYEDVIDNDLYYEFGTLTPEDCFRDLYWNKVYSVKNYIPRLQMSKHEKTSNYLAIKGVNKKGAKKNNPIPFNKLNLNITIPAYLMIYKYGCGDDGLSGFWRYLRGYSIPYNIDNIREQILEDLDGIGLDFYNDWLNGCLYFPNWFWHISQKRNYKNGESTYESELCECKNYEKDTTKRLYLYNNCSLVYFDDNLKIWGLNGKEPNYHLYKRFHRLYTTIPFGSKQFFSGVIKKKTNKDGAEAFYYSFGNKLTNEKIKGNKSFNDKFPDEIRPEDDENYYKYARLFSTDIILLGSLKDCDLDGVPKIGFSIPSTTCKIPPLGRYKPQTEETNHNIVPDYEDEDAEKDIVTRNGMHWGAHWFSEGGNAAENEYSRTSRPSQYKYYLGSGLFFGLAKRRVLLGSDWATSGLLNLFGIFGDAFIRDDFVPYSDLKTCVNAERICELGVTLDDDVNVEYENTYYNDVFTYRSEMDGLITKKEIEDVDSRALFATLNFNKLVGTVENYTTGYKKYDLKYLYPTNFDGRMGDSDSIIPKKFDYDDEEDGGYTMAAIAEYYTNSATTDNRSKDYLDFRFGAHSSSTNHEDEYGLRSISYKSLSMGFDGKQKYPVINEGEDDSGIVNAYNGNYSKYWIKDGYAKIMRFIKPQKRHFYGYINGEDDVYPLSKNTEYFQNAAFTFPLYDNSFYFYFGINQGNTAIDKFYEQFYTKCVDANSVPFIMNLLSTPATACNNKAGVINVNLQEITLPYSIKLLNSDGVVEEKENVNVYNCEFTGLSNGEYEVVAKDIYGTTLSEKISLKYQKITLDTNVINGILTEYNEQTCEEICKNNYNGQLRVNSYILYGKEYNVSALNKKEEDGLFSIGDNVMIKITPNNGGNFSDYICGEDCGKSDINNNIINFSKPGVFSIEVYEMCGNAKSDNSSTYTVQITDTKRLEMLINDVPLKYLVGKKEDLIPYNIWFHDSGQTISSVNDNSIKGWFGVHNPETYSELFKKPLDNGNRAIWSLDINSGDEFDIIQSKLKFMFNLSKGAYVTANGNNSFTANLRGASGELLLRSAMPEYYKFSEFNTEKTNEFNSYLTNEERTATCNVCNPNIVSENYRYVTDSSTKFPSGSTAVNSEDRIISGLYNFNPKYYDTINCAGNYFAGFSNNANIVQKSDTECEQREDYKPYQVIPYKAHDLYKDNVKMCVNGEKPGVLDKVYTSTNNNKRYFRTEFIDRRFDYNMLFITGHRGIHFDVSNHESNIISAKTTWDKARISAITYNGIDMLYTENKGNKLIISDEDNTTEYNYVTTTAEVKLNTSAPKRFYESKLYYGDGYVDLSNAFYYNNNTSAKAFYYNTVNDKIDIETIVPQDVTLDNCYKNFNLEVDSSTATVVGYPSKRLLSYSGIPYGDIYTFHNVSCSYDGINIETTNKAITAKAVPGEVVNFSIEAGELINFICNDFSVDCKGGHYNIQYELSGQGYSEAKPVKIHDLSFTIDSTGSTGFRTKVENLGVKVLMDDSSHTMLNNLKKSTKMETAISTITGATVWEDNSMSGVFDTSDNFRNHIFNVTDVDCGGNSFITMFFDRLYYSQAADSLMKRIRVFNTSTIYNVSSFEFYYVEHETKSEDFIVPKEEIDDKVKTETEVTEHQEEPDDPDEEGGSDDGSSNSSIDAESTTTASEDLVGKKLRDYTLFEFKSPFIANCLNNICFMIDYGGQKIGYTLNSIDVIEQKTDDGVKFGVLWSQHNTLLEDGEQDANIVVYMDIKNEIKSKNGEGHMEFAFGFKIRGTNASIIGSLTP